MTYTVTNESSACHLCAIRLTKTPLITLYFPGVLTIGAFTRVPPRLINAVELTKLNSSVERYCLNSSTKVNEAVDIKMAANELVRGKCCCDM